MDDNEPLNALFGNSDVSNFLGRINRIQTTGKKAMRSWILEAF
jgi:hypothetical protein